MAPAIPRPEVRKKPPHRSRRRATVDASCLSQRARHPTDRRPSLTELRSVRFAEHSEMCLFRGETLSAAAWHTRADHRRFRKECAADVHALREGAHTRGGCPVGVEQWLSREAARASDATRKNVVKTVLLEQRRQRQCGLPDPERLARLSLKLSVAAANGALRRGRFQELAKFLE